MPNIAPEGLRAESFAEAEATAITDSIRAKNIIFFIIINFMGYTSVFLVQRYNPYQRFVPAP
jgi:hypothetical protein